MFVFGNWKLHGNRHSIQTFLQGVEKAPTLVTPVLFLPFPYLENTRLPKGYALGAQGCSAYEEGPWTSQVSASMLKDVGCEYVLVGHAECKVASEMDLKEMTIRVLEAGMRPVLCLTGSVVPTWATHCILAYEPSIGKKTPLALHQWKEEYHKLRVYSQPVLYGGAIRTETLEDTFSCFDGFLLGRSSLCYRQWNALLKRVAYFAEKKQCEEHGEQSSS